MKESKILGRVCEESHNGSNNLMTIEKLPEECLIYIFYFLSPVERIRIERVSKTWKNIHC